MDYWELVIGAWSLVISLSGLSDLYPVIPRRAWLSTWLSTLDPKLSTIGSSPVAEELESVLHFFGGPGTDHVEQAPHLLAYAEALLLRDHDARVVPAASEEIRVEGAKCPMLNV